MGDLRVTFTEHAVRQDRRRQLDMSKVAEVAKSPDQIVPVRTGHEFRQSLDDDQEHLIRVLVDVLESEILVITMYRTSKVEKYWQS